MVDQESDDGMWRSGVIRFSCRILYSQNLPRRHLTISDLPIGWESENGLRARAAHRVTSADAEASPPGIRFRTSSRGLLVIHSPSFCPSE